MEGNKEEPLSSGVLVRDVLIFSCGEKRFVIKDRTGGRIGGIRHASNAHYKAI